MQFNGLIRATTLGAAAVAFVGGALVMSGRTVTLEARAR